jgi:predicted dehydrogenase
VTGPAGDAAGELRVAMVGHAFMGAAHSHAWRTAPHVFDLPLRPVMAVLCGRSATAATAARLGWASVAADWQDVVTRDDVDLVDICVPGYLHEPIAVAALAAGKHVLCEKPLANTLDEATRMAAAATGAAQVAGARTMVGFNYRRVPAIARARTLVAAGRIGEVREVRAAYLQDWLADPSAPWTWRMSAEQAGSGALGDIGSHIIDLTQYLTGSLITGVSAISETFTRSRPLSGAGAGIGAGAGAGDSAGGGTREVTVDDAVMFSARLAGGAAGGAIGSYAASRVATGRKNALSVELYGTEGSLAFDLERLNELRIDGQRVLITEPGDPYLGAWWPPGHVLGWDSTFVHEVRDLVTAIADGTSPSPSFADGLAVQRVLDAVSRSAANDSLWTAVGTVGKGD